MHRICLATLLLAANAIASEPARYDDLTWQAATRDDMQLFAPYIGTFRGPSYQASDDGREFYFTIDYQWYDRDERIVKYQLTTEFPESGESRPLGEGFYMFDATTHRIQVVGAFVDGRSGSGFMTPFDVESGAREVRVLGRAPDGTVSDVRDTFQRIDEDHWRNVTFILGPDGEWNKVHEAVYERVASE